MKKKKKNLVHKDFSGSSSTVTFTRYSHFASSAGLSMDNIGGFNCYNSLFVSQMFSFGPMSDGCNHALPRYGLITQYFFNLFFGWVFNLLMQSGRNYSQSMKPRSDNNCYIRRVCIHNDKIYLHRLRASLYRQSNLTLWDNNLSFKTH